MPLENRLQPGCKPRLPGAEVVLQLRCHGCCGLGLQDSLLHTGASVAAEAQDLADPALMVIQRERFSCLVRILTHQ